MSTKVSMAPTVVAPPSLKVIPFQTKLMCGGVAGVIGTSIIFPIDMVKTRLQSQSASNRLYSGGLDCFRKIIKFEGVRGLYRGLGPNLIGVTPEKAIKLSVNDVFREYFAKKTLHGDAGNLPLSREIMSGGMAGLCQVIATNPMEMVKIQMQVEGATLGTKKSSAVEVVRRLGLSGLYRGTPATLLRDVPFSFIFFPAASNLKLLFKNETGTVPFHGVLLSGLGAGCLAAFCVTPMDVVKTRLQIAAKSSSRISMIECYKSIWNVDGFQGFFKGAPQRCMIIAPLFGITLLVYEAQQRLFNK